MLQSAADQVQRDQSGWTSRKGYVVMKQWISKVALIALVIGAATSGACSGEKMAETTHDSIADTPTQMAQTAEASKDAVTHAINDADLPEGFQSDIPLYKGARLVRAVNQPGGIIMAKSTSSDDAGAIAKFYHGALSKCGWTQRPGMDNPIRESIPSFESDDTALTVQLAEMLDETTISLKVATNK
jgi:hypothetical protein